MKKKLCQGRRLIALLKRKRMTYMEMLDTRISLSPWRRVTECLADHEQVIKAVDSRGLMTWRVIAATKATA